MKSKIAIVTGASSGIGAATAELLANSGYKVYGTGRGCVKTPESMNCNFVLQHN